MRLRFQRSRRCFDGGLQRSDRDPRPSAPSGHCRNIDRLRQVTTGSSINDVEDRVDLRFQLFTLSDRFGNIDRILDYLNRLAVATNDWIVGA